MARAFIAAVPLGLVLVAAVLVAVAVTPGTFGFHDWPEAGTSREAVVVALEPPATRPVARTTPAAPRRPVARPAVAIRPVAASHAPRPHRDAGPRAIGGDEQQQVAVPAPPATPAPAVAAAAAPGRAPDPVADPGLPLVDALPPQLGNARAQLAPGHRDDKN